MSVKPERSKRNVKILNVEKINSLPPLPVMTSVPLSPNKHITMTIAKPKTSPRKQNMDHYVLHTTQGETNAEGSMDEIIDFILTDNDADEKNFGLGGPSGEITEELHISGDEHDEEDGVGGQSVAGDVNTEEIIEHVCGKCYKTFRRVSGLKRHFDFCRFDSGYKLRKDEMLKNLEKIEKDAIVMENKDICFCCGESFDTCHLGHINCPDCPKSFKTQANYERHIFITHSEFNDYPCDVCNAKLRSENLLKLHLEQHTARGKPFACKICGKDFTRAYHLKRHQKYSSCSAEITDAMYCKVCNKAFYRLDNLRAHLKQHLGEFSKKKSEYRCGICKNNFYSLSTLNIHVRTHTGERPFDCDLCDKKFPSLVALKKHRRYHTGEKPYSCDVCSQAFAVKEVLNRHMKRHTGERPHSCSECKKSFIQATQLRNHIKTHLRPYECNECPEKFKTEKQLLKHEKVHKRKLENKKYYCKLCNKYFVQHKALLRHVKTKQHLAIEEARKSQRTDCAICEKNFDNIESLEFHILKMHEVDPDEVLKKSPTSKRTPKIIKVEQGLSQIPESDENHVEKKVENTNSDLNSNILNNDSIADELPTTSGIKETVRLGNNQFTITPLNSDGEIRTERIEEETACEDTKSNIRKTLAESFAAAITDDESNVPNSDEARRLKENVCKLLDMLVDKATLRKFGWPDSSVEKVLCKVIENCGHDLSRDSENFKQCDFITRMREYVKLLFTVVIQNDSIKELLNNYPIDEVIEYVLGNDDDDDDDDDNDEADVVDDGNDNNEDEDMDQDADIIGEIIPVSEQMS